MYRCTFYNDNSEEFLGVKTLLCRWWKEIKSEEDYDEHMSCLCGVIVVLWDEF